MTTHVIGAGVAGLAAALALAEVGRRLGFDEPTNFGRFFHREAGLSPGAFRAAARGIPPPLVPGQRRPAD